jgi:Arc/MetJ-type ribon-helix-helix transcriptional regulator
LQIALHLSYARVMAQLVTRLDAALVSELDQLVAEGVFTSRSEAVRLGLARLVDDERRRRVGQAIVDGYRRVPQTPAERADIDDQTRRLVDEEPW